MMAAHKSQMPDMHIPVKLFNSTTEKQPFPWKFEIPACLAAREGSITP